MKLLLKQRIFSWFDSYDIYFEDGSTAFTVKGQFAWGHCLKVFDRNGNELATLKEKVLRFLPTFEIYRDDNLVGTIHKEFTLFHPEFTLNFRGWHIDGDIFEWNYSVLDGRECVMTVTKKIMSLTDTYIIDVVDERNLLDGLLVVLAIDAEKCSRN